MKHTERGSYYYNGHTSVDSQSSVVRGPKTAVAIRIIESLQPLKGNSSLISSVSSAEDMYTELAHEKITSAAVSLFLEKLFKQEGVEEIFTTPRTELNNKSILSALRDAVEADMKAKVTSK